jgi:putative MATE family efflux protein
MSEAGANPAPSAAPSGGVFTTGNTMRHVVTMTATGSIGLMAIFLVDLISLVYVSWLKNDALTAAVGFSTVVLFLATSVNIGLMIASTALTARALGARDTIGARRLAGSSLVLSVAVASGVTLLILPLASPILALLGARGETADVAWTILMITLPSNLLMAIGMVCSGLLRAVGDARRAMYVTLIGGIVTAVVDPLLIFGLNMGVYGVAIGLVLSRLSFALVGIHGAVVVHRLVARPRIRDVTMDTRAMMNIAVPAILTNIATPLSLGVVAAIVARFGEWAVAANTVIDRLVPVAFGALFALSGAVGPILAQNWGAGEFGRMRQALRDAMVFCTVYVLSVWMLLLLGRHQIIAMFALSGPAADAVLFFCWVGGPTWLFIGWLFTANASFNNLGFPLYSTAFNWGRAVVGTVPTAWIGAMYYGFNGALIGILVGSAAFGIAAAVTAFGTIGTLERRAKAASPVAAPVPAE